MEAYLFNWNPKKYDWDSDEDPSRNLTKNIKKISEKEFVIRRWSCGKLKNINIGDEIYIIRLGVEPKGIVASGTVISQVKMDIKWDDPLKTALYVDIKFNCILDASKNDILRLEYLKSLDHHWTIQGASKIPNDIHLKLKMYWSEISKISSVFPNEIIDNKLLYEGITTQVLVNKYERNPEARELCIKKYGLNCYICDFNFEKYYGDLGKEFIHVHHIKPLSEIKKNYIVDPYKDLIPVCPNCHSMIHRSKGLNSIVELKKIIKKKNYIK